MRLKIYLDILLIPDDFEIFHKIKLTVELLVVWSMLDFFNDNVIYVETKIKLLLYFFQKLNPKSNKDSFRKLNFELPDENWNLYVNIKKNLCLHLIKNKHILLQFILRRINAFILHKKFILFEIRPFWHVLTSDQITKSHFIFVYVANQMSSLFPKDQNTQYIQKERDWMHHFAWKEYSIWIFSWKKC